MGNLEMAKPDWLQLMESWRPLKMGELGPSLPFIVGARGRKLGIANLGPSQVQQVIDEFINFDSPDLVIVVNWCPHIETQVFTAVSAQYFKPKPNYSPPRRGSFVFGKVLAERWSLSDISQLLARLVQDASEPVRSGNYSRRAGKWCDFNDAERIFVNKVLAISESAGV